MILTRSPHYIFSPIDYPTTTTKVTLNLYVWSGLSSTIPIEANYVIEKNVPSVNTNELRFDISNMVNDYLEQTPTQASTTSIITTNTGHSVWCYYSLIYTDDTETIADITGTILAVEGFGYYPEGINPDIPTNKILLDGTIFQMSRTGIFMIPFLNDGTYNEIIVSEGFNVNSYLPVQSDNSDNIINYLVLKGSEYQKNHITITFGNESIYIAITDECKFEPNDVVFLNKYGMQQIIPFFKDKKDTLKTESKDFKNNHVKNSIYDTSKHQIKQLNKTGGIDFSMVSGYYEEENNEAFKQLMLSEKLYILKDGVFIPITIRSSSLKFDTQLRDKLISYTINFEYAFDEINNI